MGFVIQTHFCVWAITDKYYCVTTIKSLGILKNIVLLKTHENSIPNSRKIVCVTTLYIQDNIMIVFSMAFKRVLKILKTYVNFRGLQEENCFCSGKIMRCRDFCQFLTFSIKWEHNNFNVNGEQSDCGSHPNTRKRTIKHVIQGVSQLVNITAGGDFIGLCDQKIQISTCPNLDSYGVMTA